MQRQSKTVEPERDEEEEDEEASASRRARNAKATPRKGRLLTSTSDIVHSMVATCRLYMCQPSEVSNPNAWTVEEVVIPPCLVSNTSDDCIGRALVSRIEELCFGASFLEWFRAWSKLTTIMIILFYNDGASSNRVLNKKLAELFSCAVFAEYVLWFLGKMCACHKLGRCAVTLFDRFGITGHVYTISRFLRMHAPSRKLHDRNNAKLDEKFEYDAPPAISRDSRVHASIKKLLDCRGGRDPTPLSERRSESFYKIWDFLSEPMSLFEGRINHRCRSSSCKTRCVDRASALARLKRCAKNALFTARCPLFQIGRALEVAPHFVFCGPPIDFAFGGWRRRAVFSEGRRPQR